MTYVAANNAMTAAPRVDPDRRLRILIVEDHHDTAESMAMLLAEWGHEARIARDGVEALRIYDEFRPRVVMLDLALPDHQSGYDVAAKLRERAGPGRLFMIVVTGLSAIADQSKSNAAGISHHLVKPVNPHVLRWILSTCQYAEYVTPG